MIKTAVVQARIDPALKQQVDVILHHIGLNTSQAVNVFYAQILMHRGLPFDLKIPNKKTLLAMDELEGERGVAFSNFDDMIRDAKSIDA